VGRAPDPTEYCGRHRSKGAPGGQTTSRHSDPTWKKDSWPQQHIRATATPALDHGQWVDHARVFLQPIAAPLILGLSGFAGATFIVAAHMAGWYGDASSALYLFPFAGAFGGIAQFAAGMWAYRARDGLATAMHGM
jgi:hypothetical protein